MCALGNSRIEVHKAMTRVPQQKMHGLVLMVFCAICCLSALYTMQSTRLGTKEIRGGATPLSFSDMLNDSLESLGEMDIARMNVLCAEGLPGAEDMKINDCLAQLDVWAARVRSETKRNEYRFRQNPAEFEQSEGFFRILFLAVVLAEDFHVKYASSRISTPAQARIRDGFFNSPQHVFLQGVIGPRREGTCSSLPVLYVAIGRRLGYPLKLVTTKGHLFVRWEDSAERFNIEATGQGVNRFSDEYYRQWPFELTDEEIKAEGYLKSLTPAEELAAFLSIRGMCLQEAGQYADAAAAFKAAAGLSPGCRIYKLMQDQMQRKAADIARTMVGVNPDGETRL